MWLTFLSPLRLQRKDEDLLCEIGRAWGHSQPSALREEVSSPASSSAARRSADSERGLLMRAKLAYCDSRLTAKVTVIVQIRERLVVSRKRNMMGHRAVRNASYFHRQTRESPDF